MNFFENITMRRTRTKSDSNTVINETINNSTFEDTVSSLPDLSNDDINDAKQQQITKLKQQIDRLMLDLDSAHQEIESLSSENSNLKQINLDLQKKNDLFSKLSSPVKKHQKCTPIKKSLNKNRGTQTEPITVSNQEKDMSSPSRIQNKTSSVETKLQQIPHKNYSKICILSTNNRHNIGNIAKQTLHNHSVNICHYIKTHCNTQQLVHDIETKLETFTMKDFCIILIGEEDFKTTCDYLQLTLHLRATLQKVSFTNIIVCTPTFNCSYQRNMYNWRVEHLNNLLYLDTLTYEHAYLLDSNKNLAFDSTMFTGLGLVNRHGMQTIFKDIDEFINGIKKYDLLMTDDYIIPDSQQLDTQFFL